MIYLEIISPEKMLYTGEITIVKLPGTLGSFEIMDNHAPIISTLSKGKIKVKDTKGVITFFEIRGGLVEASDNRINVLVEN
ncbi:MAG TPA: F0F1 ATP synthase subunit epsilon [Prolixibacteraceae bacterium]|nr:F0F1 ATP synthase subunit epsilon [Prolixibacteraceae bacterium]